MSVGKQQIHGSLLPWQPLWRPHSPLKTAAQLQKKLMTISLVSIKHQDSSVLESDNKPSSQKKT